MERFAALTGRRYGLVDYVGHPEAERVVVMMGSGAETTQETVDALVAEGEKVGLLKVRLYRPFPAEALVAALPASVRRIAVLDRTKEPGALGEPLFLDVMTAVSEHMATAETPRFAAVPRIVGGRYGLSGKEFDPPMVRAVFAELAAAAPKSRFTVGITDDVSGLSLPVARDGFRESDAVFRAVFYGLGSDGTVGANKNSIKIVAAERAEATGGAGGHAQGYFVYDSRKAGAVTVSHLRVADRPIRSAYLIGEAPFVACHQFALLDRYEVLSHAAPGGTLLLNAPHPAEDVWDNLPREVQEAIVDKGLEVWTIDAAAVAQAAGLGRRINTIMQTCFFRLAGVIDPGVAIDRIKQAIDKTYGRKSTEIVRRNHAAVDMALDHLHRVAVPAAATADRRRPPPVPAEAPDFVQRVTAAMLAGHGDALPVSAFPPDGTWPVGTAKFEKRNIAAEIPVWDPEICIQCNKCALVCPHASVRVKVAPAEAVAEAPPTFKHVPWKGKEFPGAAYMVQVAPEDCTGCTLCVEVCPAKDKANPKHKALEMQPHGPLKEPEAENFAFFLDLPEADRAELAPTVKHVQLMEPLFEFSGACSGCGETPYIKLMTQLFGDRSLIANATGCSSIFGGNLPTTPYTANAEGRGPAWSNSLFEDNAEFGLGLRLAVDRTAARATALVMALADAIGADAAAALVAGANEGAEAAIATQRARVADLRARLAGLDRPDAAELSLIADYLVRKNVWIVGGDGWAYDIGYGGVDHVLGSGRDVNLLVLDTEVYSNTGGQQSKATPLGAAAKFAMAGRSIPKKDLAMAAMAYEHVYVARVAFGAKDAQTLKAFQEAESYPGPSLIIAYSPCIAHGYDLAHGLDQQKLAVDTGHWPLFRFDPRRLADGKKPLVLDSGPPKVPLSDYTRNETRFRMVERQDPERWKMLLAAAEEDVKLRWDLYAYMAGFAEEGGMASRRPRDAGADAGPGAAAAE
jgi:pyruvate-ferredoxin/flavodoxin oxidoreductase